MDFFLDTAEVNDIRRLAETGLVDGVTTNPSLVMKSGRTFVEVIAEICAELSGPVSAEVTATEWSQMAQEGRVLGAIAPNVVVKLPLTFDGLKACRALTLDGLKTNVTLCFSAAQGLLAAKAGATYVSPFIGRLDDIGADGMQLIEDLREIFDIYDFDTQILAASIRSAKQVESCALAGADVATLPPKIFDQLVKHPLTDVGLEAFLQDWAKTGQTISGPVEA